MVYVRSIVLENPRSVMGFSFLYGAVSLFFLANFYSWGLHRDFLTLFTTLLISAPVYGLASFALNAWTLELSAKLLRGPTNLGSFFNAVMQSKLPYLLSLGMWLVLAALGTESVFIHYTSSTSAVSIILISLSVYITSYVLLIRSLQRLMGCGAFKATLCAILSAVITFSFSLIAMFIGRYIFLITIN
jgi:hypothetical protein